MNVFVLPRVRAIGWAVGGLALLAVLDAEPRLESVAASPAASSVPAGFV